MLGTGRYNRQIHGEDSAREVYQTARSAWPQENGWAVGNGPTWGNRGPLKNRSFPLNSKNTLQEEVGPFLTAHFGTTFTPVVRGAYTRSGLGPPGGAGRRVTAAPIRRTIPISGVQRLRRGRDRPPWEPSTARRAKPIPLPRRSRRPSGTGCRAATIHSETGSNAAPGWRHTFPGF